MQVSLEAALQPHLFPTGCGPATSDIQLATYCKLRVSQFFSGFTLFKPYSLFMYSLLMMQRGISALRFAHIERRAESFRRRNPHAPEAEMTRHLLKNCLPPTLEQSPKWWSQQLADLKAVVRARGLPTLFVTFTADEFSSTCFPEYEKLKVFLEKQEFSQVCHVQLLTIVNN